MARGAAALLGLALAAPLAAQQATGTIRGRVVERGTQRPIDGAQVTIVGTTVGGITSTTGDFVITGAPAGEQRVRARRIGFSAQEQTATVPAGGAVTANFTLQVAASQLDQVVVTGTPGATEKRTLGNAITTLDVADLTAKSTVSNVTEILQSRTPGVTVLPGSGAVGTAADIRIRGASSLSGYRPVIFIDGIRYNNSGLGNFNPTGSGLAGQAQSSQATNAFDFINPNDIESIEVIKGPAAATLYGADAAGGVIQIITKKGAKGQQRPRWAAKYEVGQNSLELDTPINYTTCDSAKIAAPTLWPGCTGAERGTILTDNPLERDPDALRTGQLQRVSVSVQGGGDRYGYYVSGDGDSEQGVLLNNYNKRRSARANFSFTPADQADFTVNMGYVQTDLRLPYQDESANSLLLSAVRGRPGRAVINAPGFSTVSPEQANAYNNRTESDRLTLGTTVNYRPVDWFRNRLTAGIDNTTSVAQLLSLPGSIEDTEGFVAQRIPRTRIYTIDYAGSVVATLPRSFESTSSFGTQIIANREERLDATGTGLGAPDVSTIGIAAVTSGNNTFSENNSVGYYVQQQVAWNNRLFVTGAVRADDNSSFGTNFDLIVYPKFSLSYVASEEPGLRRFFDAVRAGDVKLRTAWGQAGRAPAPYSATQTYTVDRVTLGTTTASALRTNASGYGNPDLKPERGEEIEVGVDAGFFGDRAGLEFTYYHKTTTDMLLSVALPGSLGFAGTRFANLGEVRNSGVELGLTATPISRPNFAWDSRINLATNANELVSFGDPAKTSETPTGQAYGVVQQHRVGYPLGGYWVQLPQRDASGAPVLDDSGRLVFSPLRYLGPSAPTREVGFANTFTLFKNFQLYGLFDYKGGFYLFNQKERNRCQTANDNCRLVNDPNASDAEKLVARSVPGVYVEKADFVKLRELSLSYSLPASLIGRTGVTAASLRLAGYNLALWTDYSGIDPEVNSYGGRNFVRADAYAMPMTQRVALSVNVTY